MSTDAAVRKLCTHLRATGELPVDRDASRWLGEAEAVACDLVGAGLDETTVERRLRTVRKLLAEVESTGSAEADEHVAAARETIESVLESSATDRK